MLPTQRPEPSSEHVIDLLAGSARRISRPQGRLHFEHYRNRLYVPRTPEFLDVLVTTTSQAAEKALHYIAELYKTEREVKGLKVNIQKRMGQEKAAECR